MEQNWGGAPTKIRLHPKMDFPAVEILNDPHSNEPQRSDQL